MPSSADHNYELIEFVADGLGEAFLAEVAFVGGCTTAMLVTDAVVLDDIRFTDDVDLVIELAGISAWQHLTERLAAKNFKITGEDEVNCRFRFNDVVVDVMPSDPLFSDTPTVGSWRGWRQQMNLRCPAVRSSRYLNRLTFLRRS